MFLLSSKLSKTTQILFVSFFVICSIFVCAKSASADSIGMSPPKIIDKMEPNERFKHTITLMRSKNIDKSISLNISVVGEGSELVDLYSGKVVSFSPGEEKIFYTYAIDTDGAIFGNFNPKLHFILDELVNSNGLQMHVGLVHEIVLEILPKSEKERVVYRAGVLEEVDNLFLRHPKVKVVKNKSKTNINISTELINKTKVVIAEVPYIFNVYKGSELISSIEEIHRVKIQPNKSDIINETFKIKNRYKTIGKYRFVYKIGDLTTELNYFLIPPEYVFLALMGFALPFSMIHLTCRRYKKTKKS